MGRGRGRAAKGAGGSAGKCGKERLLATLGDETLSPGPQSIKELLDFPDHVWQRLFKSEHGADRLTRLQVLLGSGLQLSSQYSGKGTAETCVAHLAQKFQEEGVLDLTTKPWQCASAFDCKQFAVDVLLRHEGLSKCSCVFGDFLSTLSPAARAEVDRLTPAKAQALEERRSAYRSMDVFLRDNLSRAFPDDREAACFAHPAAGHCRVWPERPLPATFTMWVAGQTCKDVSTRGKRQGFAGPHTKSYVVWLNMVRAKMPDMIVHEITCSSEAEVRLQEDLGELYDFQTCPDLSPHQLGIPVQRHRQYSIGVLREKFVNIGSWEEFRTLMASRCMLTGEVYFQADEQHRAEVGRMLASKQGWFYHGDDMPSLEDSLTPAEFRRFSNYREKAKHMSLGTNDFYCCDVEQEAAFGTISMLAPCLISHGKLVNGKTKQLATGMEHLLMMGALSDSACTVEG